MIKINLLRNRIQESSAPASAGIGPTEMGQSREALVKVAIILMLPLGLMLWEAQNLRALTEEQNRLQAEATKLKGDALVKATEAEKLKDVEVQAKELEDKLKILKLLSKLRLRHVKTLDFVQSSIPEKVWLKNVTYESDKVHVQGGHFQFSGFATATEELTEFVRRLDGSAYLADVIVMRNKEVAAAKSTSIRDFLFTAEVENKN